MKHKSSSSLFILIFLLFLVRSAYASNIVQIAMATQDIPFLLDDEGYVWAFQKPMSYEGLIKLPILNHIKNIAPYIAVDTNGNVFTWGLNFQESDWVEGELSKAGYTSPQ